MSVALPRADYPPLCVLDGILQGTENGFRSNIETSTDMTRHTPLNRFSSCHSLWLGIVYPFKLLPCGRVSSIPIFGMGSPFDV